MQDSYLTDSVACQTRIGDYISKLPPVYLYIHLEGYRGTSIQEAYGLQVNRIASV